MKGFIKKDTSEAYIFELPGLIDQLVAQGSKESVEYQKELRLALRLHKDIEGVRRLDAKSGPFGQFNEATLCQLTKEAIEDVKEELKK